MSHLNFQSPLKILGIDNIAFSCYDFIVNTRSGIIMSMDKDKFEFVHSKALTKKEKKFYVNIYKKLCCLIKDEHYKNGNNKEQRI